LIFLKYISDAFELQRAKLEKEEYADPDDPEDDLAPEKRLPRLIV